MKRYCVKFMDRRNQESCIHIHAEAKEEARLMVLVEGVAFNGRREFPKKILAIVDMDTEGFVHA